MKFKTLRDLRVQGLRVLLCDDLNVPFRDGEIADFTRIDAALPTLRYLREAGARIAVISHRGRPAGKIDPRLSLRPLVAPLSERLGFEVGFASDCAGNATRTAIQALEPGGVLLLENARFHPEEERNDPAFAAELASLAEVYVNDAFGTAHRAHASTEGVAHFLPSAAGLLMEAELRALSVLTEHPTPPYVCVIGGAKVADKMGVFERLSVHVNAFLVGGGMANTFLAAQGVNVGHSLRDDDLEPARRILALVQERSVSLQLPTDAVVAPSFAADSEAQTVALEDIGPRMIVDIGPQTARAYATAIEPAKTIVFNGPMGVYEKAPYREGTRVVGEAIVKATAAGATSVIGGGDAAAAAQQLGFASGVSHVSTGGGATLEFLEGKTLPALAALERSV